MRYLLILLLLAALIGGIGCAGTAKTTTSFVLNGIWVPVKQEMGGKELPASFYVSQQLEIKDSTYTLTAESVDRGILKYKNGEMDIYGREGVNNGKHLTARYKLENDQLTIIYNLKGDVYPADFDSKPTPALFLSVFKRKQ